MSNASESLMIYSFADNGAVVIRQSSPAASRSSSSNQENDYQHTQINPDTDSSLEGAHQTTAPAHNRTAVSQQTEPPPSYEYVMSHNYPILEESTQ